MPSRKLAYGNPTAPPPRFCPFVDGSVVCCALKVYCAVRAVYLGIAEDVVAPLEPGLVGVGVARMRDVDERLRLLRRGQAAGNRHAFSDMPPPVWVNMLPMTGNPMPFTAPHEAEAGNRIVLTHLGQSEVGVPVAHVADTAVHQRRRREHPVVGHAHGVGGGLEMPHLCDGNRQAVRSVVVRSPVPGIVARQLVVACEVVVDLDRRDRLDRVRRERLIPVVDHPRARRSGDVVLDLQRHRIQELARNHVVRETDP